MSLLRRNRKKTKRKKPIYEDSKIKLYHDDCLKRMQRLKVQVDSIITDPPYHLTQVSRGGSRRVNDPETPFGRTRLGSGGFMGKTWDGGDVAFRPETWAACLEVTKPGGFLLAFGGTRTFHRLTCAIEDAGWEIRDCIMWVYGSGFPKSLDISKAIDKAAGIDREDKFEGSFDRHAGPTGNRKCDVCGKWLVSGSPCRCPRPQDEPQTDAARIWSGYGTALKPAWEPIIVAMKPLDGTFAQNAQRNGVAGLAIDECRVDLNGDYKCGANGRPSQTGLGDNYRPEAANLHSPVGRFPANLIHDGSDEVLAGFPYAPGQLADISHTAPSHKTSNVYGAMNREGEPSADSDNEGVVGFKMKPGARRLDAGSAARFFYCAKASRSERGKTNKHPTVKPLALMRYLCRLTKTPTGGTVLDPFSGSGSTLIAASLEGREAIGIEQDKRNCEMAVDRFKKEFKKRGLFSGL